MLTDINYQLNFQIWYYIISKKSYYNVKKQFFELKLDMEFSFSHKDSL